MTSLPMSSLPISISYQFRCRYSNCRDVVAALLPSPDPPTERPGELARRLKRSQRAKPITKRGNKRCHGLFFWFCLWVQQSNCDFYRRFFSLFCRGPQDHQFNLVFRNKGVATNFSEVNTFFQIQSTLFPNLLPRQQFEYISFFIRGCDVIISPAPGIVFYR